MVTCGKKMFFFINLVLVLEMAILEHYGENLVKELKGLKAMKVTFIFIPKLVLISNCIWIQLLTSFRMTIRHDWWNLITYWIFFFLSWVVGPSLIKMEIKYKLAPCIVQDKKFNPNYLQVCLDPNLNLRRREPNMNRLQCLWAWQKLNNNEVQCNLELEVKKGQSIGWHFRTFRIILI